LNAYGFSDAAKRCSDHCNAVAIIENEAKNYNERWVAIRLVDGGSDGVTYDSRAAAVKHQSDEFLCAYILVPPTGMAPREAEIFMAYHRKLYDAGFRLPDPASVIMPITDEGVSSQLRALRN
jgi:hypothetical protein